MVGLHDIETKAITAQKTDSPTIFLFKRYFFKFCANEFRKYINNNPFDVDNNGDMLSKNKTNYIISLQKKKSREKEKLYIVEGDKIVMEYISAGVPIKILAANPVFINSLKDPEKESIEEIVPTSYEELKKISSLKTPHNALAVVKTPDNIPLNNFSGSLCVALDYIQDPGNMGTIIRAAAWFGIRQIICSANCVDVFNPKSVQASMGAILKVNIFYGNLEKMLDLANRQKVPVYGATLDGDSIYDTILSREGIILLGNESRGISKNISKYVTQKITIPFFGETNSFGIESLNVGMAASVIFSEFSRR